MSGAIEFDNGTVVALGDMAGAFIAFLDLMEPPAGPSVEPWFPGQSVDHVYEHCPALLRTTSETLRPKVGRGALYPEADDGMDTCGWCLRVWRSRQ